MTSTPISTGTPLWQQTPPVDKGIYYHEQLPGRALAGEQPQAIGSAFL